MTLIDQKFINFLLNNEILFINEVDNLKQKLEIPKIKNSPH